MAGFPEARLLDDGKRLHLHHGPIDLVIGAEGDGREIALAYERAETHFQDILATLAGEIDGLRKPVAAPRWTPEGPVAQRMMNAVWSHRRGFVTPMAAVAGAVADEMIEAMTAGRDLRHAYVNNSGDIAFYLTPGASLRLGLVGDLHRPAIDGVAALEHGMPIRGVATSGWAGRSWSFGIADAVTVLARDAAAADVAATLIANAVNVDHPAIRRRPASEADDNTDLGDRLVTVGVGELDPTTIDEALESGVAVADRMARAGQIEAAVLLLRGRTRAVGDAQAAIAA